MHDAIEKGNGQEEVLETMLATLELIEDEGKLPDNDWLIIVLSHIPGKTCPIF